MKNDVFLLRPLVLTAQKVLWKTQIFHAGKSPHGAEEFVFLLGYIAYKYPIVNMDRDERRLTPRILLTKKQGSLLH